MKLAAIRWLALLGLAALCAGCFGFLGGGPKMHAAVLVSNDLVPPARMTIELRKDGKKKATLGDVSPGDTRTLTYSSGDLSGSYQLVARQVSGAALTSRNFALFDNARIRWELRGNDLSVLQGQ